MQYTSMVWKALLCAALWQGALTVCPARDLDLLNLQENFPMRIQDAHAIPDRALNVDLAIDVGINDEAPEWLQARTQVEYGIAPGWQGVVGVRSVWSDFDETGNGDIYVEVLREIHQTPRDAVAVELKLNFPTGQNYARTDSSIPGFTFVIDPRYRRVDVWLAAIYTHQLDRPERTRLHAQLQHGFINSARLGSDPGRWFLAVGADHLIGPRTLLMGNLWWEEGAKFVSGDSAVLQLGLRRQQDSRLIWALSLNSGLGWDEADFGGTFSAQYGF